MELTYKDLVDIDEAQAQQVPMPEDTDAKEELSECCAAEIDRGICTFCGEHV